jgi:hypothetical protein
MDTEKRIPLEEHTETVAFITREYNVWLCKLVPMDDDASAPDIKYALECFKMMIDNSLEQLKENDNISEALKEEVE